MKLDPNERADYHEIAKYDEIKKHKLEDIICIDETSISGLQKRSHCYSELGKRCVIKTQSQEIKKTLFWIHYNRDSLIRGCSINEDLVIHVEKCKDVMEHLKRVKKKLKLKFCYLNQR